MFKTLRKKEKELENLINVMQKYIFCPKDTDSYYHMVLNIKEKGIRQLCDYLDNINISFTGLRSMTELIDKQLKIFY